MGLIHAMEFLSPTASFTTPWYVILYSDSNYVVNAIHGQKVRSWAQQPKRLNFDLWLRLSRTMGGIKLSVKWVPGHSGIPENERCDKLAKVMARTLETAPKKLSSSGVRRRDKTPYNKFKASKKRKRRMTKPPPLSLVLQRKALSQSEIKAKRAVALAELDERRRNHSQ